METITFDIIAEVESPYKEKFAIPRQPGLVSAAKGKIKLIEGFNNAELIKDIEQFSHLWVIFIFHETQDQGWKPLVRPPRLGGNKKTGVLSTRSTFRPNPIGMSVVKLESVEILAGNIYLEISGLDLLDKTPVIDIKPYLPYADIVSSASAGYAQQEPQEKLNISFSEIAIEQVNNFTKQFPQLKTFIKQVLKQDPRPAYRKNKEDDRQYGMSLYDLNIQWRLVDSGNIQVFSITKTESSKCK